MIRYWDSQCQPLSAGILEFVEYPFLRLQSAHDQRVFGQWRSEAGPAVPWSRTGQSRQDPAAGSRLTSDPKRTCPHREKPLRCVSHAAPDRFGDSPAKFRTDLAQHAIHNAKAFLGEGTFVLGHSLGASLLLDLAATDPFSTMVLLAPPPISIAQIHADRVLIATGEMDIPRIREFLPIAADIGNPNTESWTLPWGGHTAPVFNPAFIGRVVQWLGGDGGKTKTTARLVLIAVMFVAAIGFGVLLVPGRELEPVRAPVATMLVRYVAASAVALVVLRFVNPLHWLRLFSTDYVIGFLLVTGLALIAGRGFSWRGPAKSAPYLRATAAALYVIAVPGLLIGSRVLHMSLSDGRWWRFPFITLAGLPLFISDEWIIRRIRPRWKSE